MDRPAKPAYNKFKVRALKLLKDVQTDLVADKRLPLGHHGRRTVPDCADPALLVAHQHAGRKPAIGVPGAGCC